MPFQNTDPFIIAYVIGLLILILYARERLDIPSTGSAISQEADTGKASGFSSDTFISSLPPSSIRVGRYFWFAVALYVAGLAIIYTVLSAAIVAGLKGVLPVEVGVNLDALDTAIFTPELVPRPELTFAQEVLAWLDRPSRFTQYPWQPVLLALGMVGLLPSIMFVRAAEVRVRKLSLLVAGIPRQVIKLWEQLKADPVPTNAFDDEMHETLQNARQYYADLTGDSDSDTRRFIEQLEKIFCFKAWMDAKTWPHPKVRALISRRAPTNLESEVTLTTEEVSDLVSLSKVAQEARPSPALGLRVAQAANEGLAEAPRPYGAQQAADLGVRDIAAAKQIIGQRWAALQRRVAGDPNTGSVGQYELCCLMIALYAERSGNVGSIRNDDGVINTLRTWVDRARDNIDDQSSFTAMNFAVFVSIVASMIGFGLYLLLGLTDYVIWSKRDAGIFALRMATTLTAALVPVYFFRVVYDEEQRWKRWVNFFRPPIFQYQLYLVVAFAFCFLCQALYHYLAPIIGGTQDTLAFSDLLQAQNLKTFAAAALPGTILALFLRLAYDQELRHMRPFIFWSMVLIVIHAVFQFGALMFDPDYASLTMTDAELLSRNIEATQRQQALALVLVSITLLLLMNVMVSCSIAQWKRKCALASLSSA